MKVYLKYSFIFDSQELWNSLTDFEIDLARFFKDKGFIAETVKSLDESNPEVIIFISKSDDLLINPQPQPPQKSLKQVLNQTQQNRGWNGKFKKDNT